MVADIPEINISYEFEHRRSVVTHPAVGKLVFWEWENGIYAMDANKSNPLLQQTNHNFTTCSTSLTQTVAQNKLVCTKKEIQGAEQARKSKK